MRRRAAMLLAALALPALPAAGGPVCTALADLRAATRYLAERSVPGAAEGVGLLLSDRLGAVRSGASMRQAEDAAAAASVAELLARAEALAEAGAGPGALAEFGTRIAGLAAERGCAEGRVDAAAPAASPAARRETAGVTHPPPREARARILAAFEAGRIPVDPRILGAVALLLLPVLALLRRRQRRRRREERYNFHAAAVLRTAEGAVQGVRFFDISCGGARLFLAAELDPGTEIGLAFGGHDRAATLVWRKGRMAGIAFRQPLRPAELHALLSGGSGQSDQSPAEASAQGSGSAA